jgi:hypothetical protein
MQDAMIRRDYDDAATLLHQSFKVDRSILEGSFAEYTVPTSENPDNPGKTISDVKAALFEIFSKRFDKAVSDRSQKEITRYFKLFPLIGCYTEGLDRYSNFVCGLVRDQGSESLRLNKGLYYIDYFILPLSPVIDFASISPFFKQCQTPVFTPMLSPPFLRMSPLSLTNTNPWSKHIMVLEACFV